MTLHCFVLFSQCTFDWMFSCCSIDTKSFSVSVVAICNGGQYWRSMKMPCLFLFSTCTFDRMFSWCSSDTYIIFSFCICILQLVVKTTDPRHCIAWSYFHNVPLIGCFLAAVATLISFSVSVVAFCNGGQNCRSMTLHCFVLFSHCTFDWMFSCCSIDTKSISVSVIAVCNGGQYWRSMKMPCLFLFSKCTF